MSPHPGAPCSGPSQEPIFTSNRNEEMETENLSTDASRFGLRSATELVGDKNRDQRCSCCDPTMLDVVILDRYNDNNGIVVRTGDALPSLLLCSVCLYVVDRTARNHPAITCIFFPLLLFSPRSCHRLSTAGHRLSMLFFFSQENIFLQFHP